MQKYLLLILLSTIVFLARGQEKMILPVKEVLDQIDSKTNARIHYRKVWFTQDSVLLNEPVSKENSEEILKKILSPLQFTFIKYDDANIVIVPGDNISIIPGTVSAQDQLPTQVIGSISENPEGKPVSIQGYVTDGENGEPITGAVIQAVNLGKVITSNDFGFYSLEVPYGIHNFNISFIGYEEEDVRINALSNGQLNLEIFEKNLELEEVVVSAEASDANVEGAQTGKTKLSIEAIKSLPAFMGEVDVIKTIIMMPGVSTVGEGTAGFNVRGGEVGQNLLLLDDAIIFNSSHLFGFFSVFNSDAITDVTLYKGGVPANHGGRVSSVMQVKLKDGNTKKLTGKGGIGLVSSRLSLEGPINKGKGSFVVAGRSSYSDWLLRRTRNLDLQNSNAGFGDFVAKANYNVTEKDKVYATAYYSTDNFRLASDTTYTWDNKVGTLKWNHSFSSKLFGSLTGVVGQSSTNIFDNFGINSFDMKSNVTYQNAKLDFNYQSDGKHKIDFGWDLINYQINPGNFVPNPENGNISPVELEIDRSITNSLYVNDEITFNSKLSAIIGLRYSMFNRYGQGTEYVYQPGIPKTNETITDTLNYERGASMSRYFGLEPRASLKLTLSANSSLKLSAHRMYQYIHLISNTTAITPIDFWMSSNNFLRPEIGDQGSLGYFRNFKDNSIETSVEVYYKEVQNIVDFKEGGNITLNPTVEADLLSGTGRAYGAEFLIRKNSGGKFTGWLSYTYSRTLRLIDGDFPEETINNGLYYPSNFDKPHDITLVGNYSFTKRAKLSFNFVYFTGRPVTAPVSKYSQGNINAILNFSERNQFRIPDYHRLDLAFTLEETHKKNRRIKGSWTFSIYNLYGRRNAFSVFFDQTGFAYRLAILGTAFPSFTYNISF